MPSLVRKLLIYAGSDGLILQPHTPDSSHQVLHVDYKSRKVSTPTNHEHYSSKHDTHLESHGVIGLITIASWSFLIAVTQREQVAQIYGKPVYTITDVAVLPLSSQAEAREAISAASVISEGDQNDGSSASEYSDSDDDTASVTGTDFPGSLPEDEGPYLHKNRSNTSIAEDVAKRKASYGKFASQWLSRRVWSPGKGATQGVSTDSQRLEPKSKSSIELQNYTDSETVEVNRESKQETADKQDVSDTPAPSNNASAASLLAKILRSTKMILSSRSFYFSYEFDLTRRFALQDGRLQSVSRDKLESLYFWNRRMGAIFAEANQDSFFVPIIQGFVGQKAFSVASKGSDSNNAELSDEIVQVDSKDAAHINEDQQDKSSERSYLLTIISRRSVKRSGLRYLRRGIDDEGNCANSVETEQILSSTTWDRSSSIRSFVQVRGSIPLYFSQSPYSLKPMPMLHNSPSANEKAFKKHFQSLKDRYGDVQVASLIDKHGTEVTIGEAYQKLYEKTHEAGQLSDVEFEWFDFHAECRGMKFENVQILVNRLESCIKASGETVIANETVQKRQKGVVRTNCMDCLDRTNVAQSAFGQQVLQRSLEEDGFHIDLLNDESTNWFNILWADNGDAISRQYASTAALKGDFTRTRKRNWRGQMNDLGLTLSRYYSNMVNDYFSQAVIDVLLGNVSWKIFEDFESSMMSVDPGISVETAREAAIENCAKIVIQESNEELIHGWTMSSPAQGNTLRTLPFEETVVLLTDAAIYCCKFDWNTEKVASFEKVDLRSISKIRIGTYITSTFTKRQLDEQLNQGLVIIFTPGKGDVIRVNTRSLQNSVSPSDRSSTDGGSGILSWFTARGSSQTSRTLALKVIPKNATLVGEEGESTAGTESPGAVASRIGEEIRRAVIGPGSVKEYPDFIEEGDIISAAEAKKRTGYLEQLGHSIKKMVWV